MNRNEEIRAAAAREYSQNPHLQAEFGSLAVFQSWKIAEASGKGRISNRNSTQHEQTSAAATPSRASSAPRSTAPAAPSEQRQTSGPLSWDPAPSPAALSTALALIQSGEGRLMGRNKLESVIAARAGVSIAEAGAARAKARWQLGSATVMKGANHV